MLLKFCNKCGKIIKQSEKYCEECSKKVTDRHKEYNQHRRNKKYNDFYKSTVWSKTRIQVLQQFNYIDIYQYYINNKVVKADMVHHIVELDEDWSKRLDLNNLIPLSNATHNLITSMYKNKFKKAETQKLLYKLIEKYKADMSKDNL